MSVFLSYAIGDKPKITKVLQELRSRGLVEPDDRITDNTEILVPGSSWRGAVRQAIKAASKVVVVWSAAGGQSDWLNYEIGMAEALEKPILVVAHRSEIPSLPSSLQHRQVFELEDGR